MSTVQAAHPRTRRFTRDEYYQMAELGFFNGQRVELIDGEIVEMAPQKDQHAFAVTAAQYVLQRAFGQGFVIRVQMPMRIAPWSDPEPDLLALAGSYLGVRQHPTRADLIVEVADTSLAFDRDQKAGLYASAGVPDYWIINLVDRQIEVLRDPREQPGARFGASYRLRIIYRPGDRIVPLAAPSASVAVDELLA